MERKINYKDYYPEEFLEIQPYDAETDRLQCLECENWFKGINVNHLKFKHQMTVPEYKAKYGINKRQSVECLSTVLKHKEVGKEVGVNNLDFAKKGEVRRSGKNPKRKQNIQHILNLGLTSKAGQIVKRMWENKEFESLRQLRSEIMQKAWSNTSDRHEAMNIASKLWKQTKTK